LGVPSPIVQDDRYDRSERAGCKTADHFEKPGLAPGWIWAKVFSGSIDYTVLPRVATSPQIVRDLA